MQFEYYGVWNHKFHENYSFGLKLNNYEIPKLASNAKSQLVIFVCGLNKMFKQIKITWFHDRKTNKFINKLVD